MLEKKINTSYAKLSRAGFTMEYPMSHWYFNLSVYTRAFRRMCTPIKSDRWDLTLINLAGGLYGRILTEVGSTDRTQWGLYTRPRSRFSHTDRLSSVNKMFIIWKTQEQFNLFLVIGLYYILFFFIRTFFIRTLRLRLTQILRTY